MFSAAIESFAAPKMGALAELVKSRGARGPPYAALPLCQALALRGEGIAPQWDLGFERFGRGDRHVGEMGFVVTPYRVQRDDAGGKCEKERIGAEDTVVRRVPHNDRLEEQRIYRPALRGPRSGIP